MDITTRGLAVAQARYLSLLAQKAESENEEDSALAMQQKALESFNRVNAEAEGETKITNDDILLLQDALAMNNKVFIKNTSKK